MLGNFFPPVVFQVEAVAGKAIADFKAINTQLKIMEGQALKTGRALTTMNKATLVGTKVLKGLGLAFAGFAAIGVKEIMELERSFTRLGQAMASVGVATEQNRRDVGKLVDSYEDLGFGSEKAADAYSVLITATRNVEKSNRLLAMSADLARARNMGMEEAARTLTRAMNGNARIFTQFGITLDKSLPKAQAVEKAMADLEQRLGGQAVAFSKTFAGQLLVLNENLGDLAEQIGMRVLPFLNRLVSGLNNSGKWIQRNSDFVIALAAAITVALIPAILNAVKALGALAIAILRNPIARLAAVVLGIAYAFVKAYNSSQKFREGVATVVKGVLALFGTLVNALENVVQGIYFIEKGAILAALGIAKLTRNKDAQRNAEEQLRLWEKNYAAIDKWSDGIENAKRKVEAFSTKELKLSFDFKTPTIPGFDNETGGVGDTLAAEIKKGLAKARQDIADFQRDLKVAFRDVGKLWDSIINKDFKTLINERIGDPIDQVIRDAQASITRYEAASGQWAQTNKKLESSQEAYLAALETGSDEIIASAESAMRFAEGAVSDLLSEMADALAEVERYQEDMINAVVEYYERISELETERTAVVADGNKQRAKLEQEHLETLAEFQRAYDQTVLEAEADAARRRTEIIKTSIDQMRSAFRSATYKTLGDVYSSLTFEGRYLQGGSMEKILGSLGLQTEKAKTLADNAAKLAGMGFSQTFIEEVIALGPDVGNSLADTIMSATPDSVRQLQEYWNELNRTTLYGVDGVANTLNSGIVLATEELTAQLAQVDVDLKNSLAKAQTDLMNSTKEAMKTYNSALVEINNSITAQIGAIDLQIAQLNAKIIALQSALSATQGIAKPGTQGSTNIIPQHETREEEGDASSCASGKGVYKVITLNGQVMSRTLIRCVAVTEASDSATEAANDAAKAYADAQKDLADAEKAEAESIYGLYGGMLGSTPDATNWMQYAVASTTGAASFPGSGAYQPTDFWTDEVNKLANKNVTINVTANTNASADDIANSVAWTIRTSSDIQYYTGGGGGGNVAML